MTVLAVLVGVCALVIVALAYLVGTLRSDVRRLSSDLAEVRATPVPPSHAAAEPVEALVLVAPDPEAAGQARDESVVPVITRLPTDDLDLRPSRVASVTLARPLIKVAAFSYGLRRALNDEHRFRIRFEMRRELKRQRKMRRRRRSGQAPSMGWKR